MSVSYDVRVWCHDKGEFVTVESYDDVATASIAARHYKIEEGARVKLVRVRSR